MRIVHVSIGVLPPVFTDSGGAIQRRVRALAAEQARRGHDVHVVSPGEQDGGDRVGRVGVTYLRTRLRRPLAELEFQVRTAGAIKRLPHPPDVIHFHSEPEGSVIARVFPNAKAVMTYDYFEFRRGRTPAWPLYRRALLAYDALLPCSEYCRRESGRYWRLPDDKVFVVYNGVDLESFRPDAEGAARERARLGNPRQLILSLGRVCAQKGTDVLLDAYGALRRRLPDVQLAIAGPIEQFDAADARSAAHWRSRIAAAGATYLGVIEEPRLPALLSAADVFVMPTRELEMFGMTAVEALACGVPVVASDHGGLRETVPDGCGTRFGAGDARALAATLRNMLEDDELRTHKAAMARLHASRFAWPRIVDDLEAIYGAPA
jgi:glycosyltransferase involved in cell wall biosynthesis